MASIFEFYGYFLHGTGSAIYTRDLTRALNQAGVDVVLFSQESAPEEFDFITEAFEVKNGHLKEAFSRDPVYNGRTIHVRPDLKGLLPVYVYDSYPGYRRIIEFKDIDERTLNTYRERILEAVKAYQSQFKIRPDGYLTHHLSPLPSFVEEIRDEQKPHFVVYHGSDLNFAIKKNTLLNEQFGAVLSRISGIITLTEHGKVEVESYVASGDTLPVYVISPGVDTELFCPREKRKAFQELESKFKKLDIDESLSTARTKIIDAIYDANRDTILAMLFQELEKIEARKTADPYLLDFLERSLEAPLIIFAGKYLWTKGAAALLLAMPFVWHRFTQARLLLVGFGGSRGILEKIRSALAARELRFAAHIIAAHREIDPGSKEDVIFDAPVAFAHKLVHGDCYPAFPAENFMQNVFFAGYLDHERLAPLLSISDVFVAPSLFRESFGLVLLEAAAAGVKPVASCHSGFKDILERLDKHGNSCIELDQGFVENLGRAVADALSENINRQELHEFVRENYSWKVAAESLKSLFINPSVRHGE